MINNKSLVALCGCVDLLCPRQVTTESLDYLVHIAGFLKPHGEVISIMLKLIAMGWPVLLMINRKNSPVWSAVDNNIGAADNTVF